jgi:two-component system chemotaxis response regulator CheY
MALDILIVDDSSAIRKILVRVLSQTNLSVGKIHEASDGVEAIRMLETNDVGLIMSDVNMPNMDGLQLLGNIRANQAWKHIPVIMITTEGSQAKVLEAVQLGATGYVRKPFTPEEIKVKIEACFSGQLK